MSDHQRTRGFLFLSKRQELDGEIATYIAIECHDVCGEDTVENREQQQRVFRGLSEHISLFEQQTRLLYGGFGFRRSKTFDMDERGYERDLKLDLFATQRWSCGQGLDLGKCARELLCGFDQRRALQ